MIVLQKIVHTYLETESDSIQVDCLWTVHVIKALTERIHSDLLPLLQSISNVSPSDALDPKVLELYRHVFVLTRYVRHIHGADAPLAALTTDSRRADLSFLLFDKISYNSKI